MKSISREALERLAGPKPQKEPADSTEKSSAIMKRTGSHIVDITDQYLEESLIITEAKQPTKK
jgi:hypothetical protein